MKKYLFLLLLLLLVPSVSFSEGEKKPFVATVGADGVQRVEVAGGSYYFKPDRIVVKVNVPVEFKLTNESSLVPHNFILKAPESGIDISVTLKGEPAIVKFTPSKTGKYTFYCDNRFLFFKSHRARGMEGTLEVVE